MEQYPNYYDFLSIPHNASLEEIQKAYKAKAKEYHPDKNLGDETAKEKFQYLGEARDCLSDAQKRLAYDYKIGVKIRPQQRTYSVPPRPKSSQQENKPRSTSVAENVVLAGFAALALGAFFGWLFSDKDES